jgi:NADPH-dependent ferric siderophore reductase
VNDDLAFAPRQKKRPGLLEATIQKLFTRRATVLDIVDVGRAFRIITLGGDALRDVAWTPGDKIQLQLGGWVQRTYTPMDWDAIAGRTRILVCLHADGPGTQWARTVRRGDACVVFGPRKSISVAQAQAPVIVCGDETSLGLAAALSAQHVLLEVDNLDDTLPVVAHLGLNDANLRSRRDGDGHLAVLEADMSALLMLDPTAEIVLTGKVSTIQHMTRFLRQTGMGSGRRHTRAYWASGRPARD